MIAANAPIANSDPISSSVPATHPYLTSVNRKAVDPDRRPEALT
jgi:hypothetical protein